MKNVQVPREKTSIDLSKTSPSKVLNIWTHNNSNIFNVMAVSDAIFTIWSAIAPKQIEIKQNRFHVF